MVVAHIEDGRVQRRSESTVINGALNHSGPEYVLGLDVPEGMELVGCDIPEGFTDKSVRIVSSIPPVGQKVNYE